MSCVLGLGALGVVQAQADPGGPLSFVRQAHETPSDFVRVTSSEETLIDVAPYVARHVGAGRTFWITVEKTSRPSLAVLEALLNPPVPELEVTEEACAEGDAAFPFDGSHILDSHLEAVLSQIKGNDARVVVVGHTDNLGSDPYNCRLGLRRAQAVASFFVKHGVPRERIAIGSRGKRDPLADNKTKTGRAQNRRAVVWIHVAGAGQGEQP